MADMAMEDFLWGDSDELFHYRFDTHSSACVRCRRCGRLYRWGNIGTEKKPRWRLVTKKGDVHLCKMIARLDEFPVIE